MSNATVVYEIALFEDEQANAALIGRLQLVADSGALRLRDADGNETPCEETDIASVIASTDALREVPENQHAKITCSEDIVGKLPTLLEPVTDGASLLVNDAVWDVFPTIDGHDVMLPGECDYECAPAMNPCWAEYDCAEGGRSFEEQLVGFSSIGLLAAGVAIEHGRTEYGGNGGAAAVSITPFDDFAAIFSDWLLRTQVLSALWQGDRNITTPDIDLFAEAAAANDHRGYWQDDDAPEDDDGETDNNWGDEGSFASRSLELDLAQGQIDEVRAHLQTLKPARASALDLPTVSRESN